jgi:hypothetical protein
MERSRETTADSGDAAPSMNAVLNGGSSMGGGGAIITIGEGGGDSRVTTCYQHGCGKG